MNAANIAHGLTDDCADNEAVGVMLLPVKTQTFGFLMLCVPLDTSEK